MDGAAPKNRAAEDQPRGGDLVRVFGGWSRIEGRPWQRVQYRVTKKRDLVIRRPAILELDRRLRHGERISGQCGQDGGLGITLTGAVTADLKRVGRLEHEGAWHRRYRKVKCDVEEKGQEHSATTLHARILPMAWRSSNGSGGSGVLMHPPALRRAAAPAPPPAPAASAGRGPRRGCASGRPAGPDPP